MHDSALVRRFESVGDLAGNGERLFERDCAFPNTVGEGGTFDQFEDEIVGTDIVNLANIGMIHRRDGADLALEAVAEALGGNLDRDIAPHTRITRAVHLPHAACAYRRENLVGAEAGSGGEM